MTDAIVHRGPDDRGTWVDEAAGLALGFRRLAVLDLSPSGHQPMLSRDERFVVTEPRGPRVLVEFICEMNIRPQSVYLIEDLIPA